MTRFVCSPMEYGTPAEVMSYSFPTDSMRFVTFVGVVNRMSTGIAATRSSRD